MMMAPGLLKDAGLTPPKFIGRQPECVESVLNELRECGVVYSMTVERL